MLSLSERSPCLFVYLKMRNNSRKKFYCKGMYQLDAMFILEVCIQIQSSRDLQYMKSFRIWSCSGSYSVRMRENADQNNSNAYTFYVVLLLISFTGFINLSRLTAV